MKILDALRRRRTSPAPESAAPAEGPGAEREPPIARYDALSTGDIADRLPRLTQVELEAVDAYERAHLDRREVRDKLRYMRTEEPIDGYDALNPEQIAEALAGADAVTVKAVRDYERKFRDRREVLDEAARVLPKAPAGAEEERAQEERDARVRDGFASRATTPRQ